MFSKRTTFVSLATLVVLVVPLLMGCGATATPAATAVPQSAAPKATTAPTTVPPTAAPTKVPPTNTPAATATPAPAVGGTMVWAMQAEPDTLDPYHSLHTMCAQIWAYIGATLVTLDPSTGKLVPYLAESWTVAADGLSVDFKIRKGVKFQDGSAMTAKDYAWTFARALDPATKCPALSLLGGLKSATAVDDYTLRLALSSPSYPLLVNLTYGWFSPLSQKVVEQFGDQFGRHPMSVGPFIFKEWLTGDHVTVERNPDYNWSPPFLAAGAPYIQTIVFRFIPEYSTVLSALESGNADYFYNLLPKDVSSIKATGKVQAFESMFLGADPAVYLNLSKPPFDDARVRKALSLALDRPAMIKAVLQGMGVVQNGPVSPATIGYWPGVEKIGYGYDLPQAKALMKEAGYAPDAKGMLQKSGQALKFTIETGASTDEFTKPSEMMQQFWKALGVDASIRVMESAAAVSDLMSGNYEVIVMSPASMEFDLVTTVMLSKKAGGLCVQVAEDPQLDQLLLATRTTMDPDKRQAACAAAQKYIVEQALMIVAYAPSTFDVLSTRVKGVVYDRTLRIPWLTNAYINTK